jgi:hypothetical protein
VEFCCRGLLFLFQQENGLFANERLQRSRAEGELASFDRIHIRRLHFLRPDGTLDDPDIGSLPGRR